MSFDERVWRIAPDKGGRAWAKCLENGCIGIGWNELGDLRRFPTKQDLDRQLKADGGEGERGAKRIWTFVHEIDVGNVVVANRGQSSVLGIGRVSGPYVASNDRSNPMIGAGISQIRRMSWLVKDEVKMPPRFFGHIPPCLGELDGVAWRAVIDAYAEVGMNVGNILTKSSPAKPRESAGLLDPEADALEGAVWEAMRRHYHRDEELRARKIESVLATLGRLRCEVPGCGFDFEERYGELGHGFAHVHHDEQLARRGGATPTKLSQLKIVCPNCHAMIHRGGQCRSLEDLIPAKKR